MNADISILFHWRKDVSNSGIAIFNNKDRITKFVEKPLDHNDNGNWVNAGVYYIKTCDIIDLIEIEDDFGFDIFPRLLNMDYDLYGLKTSSDLIAIDTPKLMVKNQKGLEIN